MARVGVGDKYHIALNGIGYLFRGLTYKKKDARAFGNRFGTGEMGESDLDTYKVIQQSDFRGGALQEIFKDASMVSALDRLAYNPVDTLVHPVPSKVSVGTGVPNGWLLSAVRLSATYKGIFYSTFNVYSSGYNSCLYGYTNGSPGSWSLSKNFGNVDITGIAVAQGYLWVAIGGGGSVWRFDGTNWTQPISTQRLSLCAFNGKLYGDADAAVLYSIDGTTSSVVGSVGDSYYRVNSMFVFNHRLYLAKADGLYAFDGVQISCIIDLSSNPVGFGAITVHDGFIYYVQSGRVHRFNGSTIEVIWDTVQSRTIAGLVSAGGYLFALASTPSGYLQQEGKGGGGLVPVSSAVLFRFDGIGWCLWASSAGASWSGEGLGGLAYNPINKLVLFSTTGASVLGDARLFGVTPFLSLVSGTATEPGTMDSSIYDCGFDNIDKVLNSVAVDTEGMVTGDTIAVSYRIFDGVTWSAYNALGTITPTSGNRLYLYNLPALNTVFKRIQFRFTLDRIDASVCAIRGYSAKYYLSPDYKREWNMTLLCQGDSDNPQELKDGSLETKTAIALRDNVYLCRESDTPVGFEDMDYTFANGSHTNVVTTITVDSAYGYASSGFIKIDDEIIRYTGRTATTFTGCTRGVLGTSAASHADNAYVTPYFRVICSDIVNESIIEPSDNSYGTPSEITIVLKEV